MLGTIATLLTSVIVVVILRRFLVDREATQREVPHVFCSWLTSTAAFAQYGCDYLAWATSQYRGGDFSVTLMFRTYTFVGTPESVRAFARAPPTVLALQPAVEQFTEKNFGLPAELWQDGEAKPAGILRKLLSPSMLSQLQYQLCVTLMQLHKQYFVHSSVDDSRVDIASAIPRWIMHASLVTIFGESFVAMLGDDVKTFLEQFEHFDKFFEAAASPLPGFLFPQYHSARAHLLHELRRGLKSDLRLGTIADSVIQNCGLPPELHAHVLLALLWAGLTNVSVTVFWAIAFLLLPCQKRWRVEVQRCISAAHTTRTGPLPTSGTASESSAAREENHRGVEPECLVAAAVGEGERSLITGCVHEAIRLRAQGIGLRKALAPLHIYPASASDVSAKNSRTSTSPQPTVVPTGSLVAVSPYQLHHDPRFFPAPHVFDPQRHYSCSSSQPHPPQHCGASNTGAMCPASATNDREGGLAGSPLRIAFGTGLFRCPGRSLALIQASLGVAVFFACADADLCGMEPGADLGCTIRGGASKSPFRVKGKTPKWLGSVPGAHVVARGVTSGDPHMQLPRFDARQLVGVKRPVETLYAVIRTPLRDVVYTASK